MPDLVRPEQRSILGMRVDATTYADAIQCVLVWARAGESRYVCCANVHMVMETYDSPVFRRVVNDADLVTADGRPLAWGLRLLGARGAGHVRGASLVTGVLTAAAQWGLRVGFYGGHPGVLVRLRRMLPYRFPGLQVAYAYAPPFRPLRPDEDAQVAAEITASRTQVLFVGLGCPKQERWMADHRGRIPAVMLGVGAAFNFLTGHVPQAPLWMQSLGLEWVYRAWQEPRLWRRYARVNPRFAVLFSMQLLGFSPLRRP